MATPSLARAMISHKPLVSTETSTASLDPTYRLPDVYLIDSTLRSPGLTPSSPNVLGLPLRRLYRNLTEVEVETWEWATEVGLFVSCESWRLSIVLRQTPTKTAEAQLGGQGVRKRWIAGIRGSGL